MVDIRLLEQHGQIHALDTAKKLDQTIGIGHGGACARKRIKRNREKSYATIVGKGQAGQDLCP
jgi:hypothetical protein